ncbi:MAG: cell wall metabolism sensor histidine kinase WalK [Planctomycetes bacterium]|nr:cell wall metabolism sensor histidine kinase WalK [Planctomycetota bacterium]
MKGNSTIVPLATGAAVALVAGLLAGPLAGGAAAAAACAAAFSAAAAQTRRKAAALERLRRPELRATTTATVDSDCYSEVVGEAVRQLVRLSQDLDAAAAERTRLEARAHVRRRRLGLLESALDTGEHPLVVTDARDRVQFANAAARVLFAIDSASEAEEAATIELCPTVQRLVCETRSRSAAGDRRSIEWEHGDAADASAWRVTSTNVQDDDGEWLGVVTLFRRIDDERAQNTRHAEFVSSVCHELKTPLSGIRAYTEMLTDGDFDDPGQAAEIYGFIEQQVDRLTRLIDNMLNLARIESGVIKVEREDCELNDVLARSFEVVRQLADEKGLRLVSELSDLYVAVHLDRDLFGQAVINLLSNAVKYTPSGGEVRLKSRMLEGWAEIEVRDTGLGIPEESLPRLFERFYRVPENKTAAAGTGLGLALVHSIVTELHNGSLRVESKVGEGSAFTISIPLGHRSASRRKERPALAAK